MSTAEEREAKAKARPDWFPQEQLFDQGKVVTLRPGGVPSQDGFFTGSQIIREWHLQFVPSVATLETLQAGSIWGVFCKIETGYISTGGVRLNSPLGIDTPFVLPVAGVSIPVHASFVRVSLERQVLANAINKNVDITVFGLPGWPHEWSYSFFLITSGPPASFGIITVPTLAYGFKISGDIAAGETIEQQTPDGTVLQTGVPVTQEYANSIQPINPDCSRLRYSSVGPAKRLFIHFYYRM